MGGGSPWFRAAREVEYACTCGRTTVIQPGEIVMCPECKGKELEWATTSMS